MENAVASPGKVVAFYSFKGGTGRSMALANVACLLAARAKRPVLVVDWDLEAPGLHRYFRRELVKAFRGSEEEQRRYPGLIDLFVELRTGLEPYTAESPADAAAIGEALDRVSFSDYVITTDRPNLDLLKAGNFADDYAAKVSAFDWQDFYARAPQLLRVLSEQLAAVYEWVLIDSRTGLTDTSGICTMLMPETLVAVFTPNLQSVEGVVDLVREAARHRAASDDLRPLLVYPLPSRIEASEPSLRKLWRHGAASSRMTGYQPAFEAAFSDIYHLERCDLGAYFDDVQIQHVPRYAYGEDIAVLGEESRDRLSLTRSFERFAERLVEERLPWEEPPAQPGADGEDGEDGVAIEKTVVLPRVVMALRREYGELATQLASRARRLLLFDAVMRASSALLIGGVAAWLVLLKPASTLVGSVAAAAALVMQGLRDVLSLERKAFACREAALKLQGELAGLDARSFDDPELLHALRAHLESMVAEVQPAPGAARRDAGTIYISYRRDDAAGYAGRLFDELVRWAGPDRVFYDLESIGPGEDFVQALDRRIGASGLVLAVIGRDWLSASDADGRRRIDQPSDFVRTELAAAFRHRVRVVPVLVDGATLPPEDALPVELRMLARLNAIELNPRRWQADVQRLLDLAKPERRRRSTWMG